MCTRPLIRLETNTMYRNKKGGLSYKAYFLSREMWDRSKDMYKQRIDNGEFRKINPVGCGQCIECKLNYSRQWATRCMIEKQKYKPEECFFLTITYDDEHIHFSETYNKETGEIITGATLFKEDMREFWDKVRHYYGYKETKDHGKTKKMKYINAGEYGPATQRPHYHAIVFGLPLNISQFKKVGMNNLNQPYWKSEELEKLWGKGNITIGELTWESVAYVARYTLKKALGKDKQYDLAQGRIPEYISMSKGIGKDFFMENYKSIYETDSVPVKNKKSGECVKPPRAYDRILKEIDPKLYEKVTEKRKQTAETAETLKLNNTSLTPEQYRQQSEAISKQGFKDIRRKEI